MALCEGPSRSLGLHQNCKDCIICVSLNVTTLVIQKLSTSNPQDGAEGDLQGGSPQGHGAGDASECS